MAGKALLYGENIFDMTSDEVRRLRGNRISMIFQDPMTSLNPVYRVGDQIVEQMAAATQRAVSVRANIRQLRIILYDAARK